METNTVNTEKKLVPTLRFKGFDGEWVKSNIGDNCKILMCKRIFAEQTTVSEEIPFYKIGTIGSVPDAFISRVLFDEYRKKYNYPRKGEVLITCSGTVGKCIPFDGKDAYYQDSNIVWIDNPTLKIRNEFLFYVLSNFDWGKLNSTTISRIYGSDLRNLPVKHPKSENEQQKIASFLSAVDEKIRQLTRKKELLEQYKKGVMQQLFSGKLRFKIKNEAGELIEPPEWEEKRLGDICESISSGKSKGDENGLFPLYGSTGKIGYCQNFSHDGEHILVAGVGANAGTINLVNGKFGVSDNTLVVICNKQLNVEYGYFYLTFCNLNKLIFGSGQPLITGGLLKSINLNVPTYPEQKKIADFLTSIDTKIESINRQLTHTQYFKKGLLQQMFV